MPALGKVGTDAAGEGVICFDGLGVVIDEEGFFVVMEGVGCTAGDADAKVGVLLLGFVIVPIDPFTVDVVGVAPIEPFTMDVVGVVPIDPCPLDVVGVAALGSVGEFIDEDGTIPFEGRATGGIVASVLVWGLKEGAWAIP